MENGKFLVALLIINLSNKSNPFKKFIFFSERDFNNVLLLPPPPPIDVMSSYLCGFWL